MCYMTAKSDSILSLSQYLPLYLSVSLFSFSLYTYMYSMSPLDSGVSSHGSTSIKTQSMKLSYIVKLVCYILFLQSCNIIPPYCVTWLQEYDVILPFSQYSSLYLSSSLYPFSLSLHIYIYSMSPLVPGVGRTWEHMSPIAMCRSSSVSIAQSNLNWFAMSYFCNVVVRQKQCNEHASELVTWLQEYDVIIRLSQYFSLCLCLPLYIYIYTI